MRFGKSNLWNRDNRRPFLTLVPWWSSLMPGLQHHLYDVRSRRRQRAFQLRAERLRVLDAYAGHAHRAREARPIDIGIRQIGQRFRLAARLGYSRARQFDLKDPVAAI